MTIEDKELELVERACRSLAEIARRDAEAAKATTVERIHLEARAELLRIAERISAARREPDPPANVRPIKR